MCQSVELLLCMLDNIGSLYLQSGWHIISDIAHDQILLLVIMVDNAVIGIKILFTSKDSD